MATKYLTQECGCVINLYSDGSLGGGEMGDRCNLHWAARDLLAACEALLFDYESQYGMDYCECDSSVGHICNACQARAAIAKAKGEHHD